MSWFHDCIVSIFLESVIFTKFIESSKLKAIEGVGKEKKAGIPCCEMLTKIRDSNTLRCSLVSERPQGPNKHHF